ncbi:mitochondrial import translocase, subunit Tom22 [Pseudovirgaria hyperparasitica]|uniref:Mitochondrial import translocase, subunit Tom22 n=1 Tax=Pseudovirgaria hyperparasitica TaxID=470096 RepID=A0A6A6WAH6_9PEZI|nr:mitochondrial import translocase, subunit Tom22 [Pseudovirgaria hyperparasitica]KAF2759179.1 mitochondrial import translocase, subunit Tom22 [Pseudovirgaria hyperparasitica]
MVRLEEVLDEEFSRDQTGPMDGEDDWDTDDDSDTSSVTSSLPDDETLAERLAALQDIIPPSYRHKVQSTVSTTTDWVKSGLLYSGKALWVISTSAILVAVPWALAYAEDQQMAEMEREMKMQQSANDLLTQPQGQEQTKASL